MNDRARALLTVLLLALAVAATHAFLRSRSPRKAVAVRLPGLDRPATP